MYNKMYNNFKINAGSPYGKTRLKDRINKLTEQKKALDISSYYPAMLADYESDNHGNVYSVSYIRKDD